MTVPRAAIRALAAPVALAIVLAVFVAREIDTAQRYSPTWDEPGHIACGLELLQYGTYTMNPLHPPLPRILIALPWYVSGIRFEARPHDDGDHLESDSTALLYDRTRAAPALFIARAPVIAVGILLLAAIYAYAQRRLGEAGALLSLLLASLSPGVLGLATQATTDLVGTATLLLALHAWRRWLEEGDARHAALFDALLQAYRATARCAPGALQRLDDIRQRGRYH